MQNTQNLQNLVPVEITNKPLYSGHLVISRHFLQQPQVSAILSFDCVNNLMSFNLFVFIKKWLFYFAGMLVMTKAIEMKMLFSLLGLKESLHMPSPLPSLSLPSPPKKKLIELVAFWRIQSFAVLGKYLINAVYRENFSGGNLSTQWA